MQIHTTTTFYRPTRLRFLHWLSFPHSLFWLGTVITHLATTTHVAAHLIKVVALQSQQPLENSNSTLRYPYYTVFHWCMGTHGPRLPNLTRITAIAQARDRSRALPKTGYLRKLYALSGCTLQRSLARSFTAAHTARKKAHYFLHSHPVADASYELPSPEIPDSTLENTKQQILNATPMPQTRSIYTKLFNALHRNTPVPVSHSHTLTLSSTLLRPNTNMHIPATHITTSSTTLSTL